jgi:hypothetical protein
VASGGTLWQPGHEGRAAKKGDAKEDGRRRRLADAGRARRRTEQRRKADTDRERVPKGHGGNPAQQKADQVYQGFKHVLSSFASVMSRSGP